MILVDLVFYLLARAMTFFAPIVMSRSKHRSVERFGQITFCGEDGFVTNCLAALRDDLPKYDPALYERLKSQPVRLTFYDQTPESNKVAENSADKRGHRVLKHVQFFTAGFFGIPENVWKHGTTGICQFVVFRYFQVTETGTGLAAVLEGANRARANERFARARERMRTWLTTVGYPGGWVKCYR